FWLVDKNLYLGTGDIRHFLTDQLKKLGGNIGYSIRPAAWRNGLGTIQLALLLLESKKLNILSPIITCFDHNIGSARIIEKNGGILLQKVFNWHNGKEILTRIYRIDIE
ncbi:MAG: GNAT family N-acetyltransferase, partial [Defluviitaleaceae bacterium]|nr:GNAT family N-acetyltransferase [Defluviitaleaceae bacterium]